MLKKLLIVLLISITTTVISALSLPKDLIAYDSIEGQQLFAESDHKQNFWQLSQFYTIQQNLTFCGVASSVMVLNALQINPPFDPIYSPYTIFTQDNIFTAAVLKVLPFYKVRAMGMTLHELAKLLAVFDLKTEIFYADQVSVEQFKKLAIQAVSDPKQAILVNFLRTQLQQRGDGHISPLAAYDSKSDRFLLLDVARFKYPAVWIKTIDLYQAMKTLDKEAGKMRGFVIIQKHS